MQIDVKVEKPSKIVRKLTITVPSDIVDERIQEGLSSAQKTANLKGFRKGKVPLNIVKQYYGDKVNHSVLHALIDDSFRVAIQKEALQTIGRPNIETPHGHHVHEGKSFEFIATVEVMPEIKLKKYTGFTLNKPKSTVTQKDVEKVIDGLRDAHAALNPVEDENKTVVVGDFIDFEFKGGLVTETGLDHKEGMSGSRLLEVGSGQLIPGFEDNLVGLKKGDEKTFRVSFPKDYSEEEFQGKESEFYVKIHEIKTKKVPEANDEFAKEAGYDDLAAMKKRAEEGLTRSRAEEAENALRNDLLAQLIEKNPFDVPSTLVQAQAQQLAKEFADHLRNQRFNDDMIKDALNREKDSLLKRAENQVRAGLLLDEVARQEKIEVKDEHIEAEIQKMVGQGYDEKEVKDHYSQPRNRENLEFRLREDLSIRHIEENSKVKEVASENKKEKKK